MDPKGFYKVFCEKLIEASNRKEISEAIKEWKCVVKFESDDMTACICGHRIKNCYVILNRFNLNKLEPIGSSCIRRISKEHNYPSLEQEMVNLDKVFCEVCEEHFVNKQAYAFHLTTKYHLKHLNSRKCLSCPARISNEEPEWKIRCIKCYRKNVQELRDSENKKALFTPSPES